MPRTPNYRRSKYAGFVFFCWLKLALLGSLLTLASGCGQRTETEKAASQKPKPKLNLDLIFDQPVAETSQANVLPSFVDVASETGLRFHYFSDDQSGKFRFPEVFGGGVACFDYDLDGWCDVFLPNGGKLGDAEIGEHRDTLFRNVNARFDDVSNLAEIVGLEYSHGCSYGDLNSDGFQDLVIANLGVCEVLINQGDGTFRRWKLDLLEQNPSWWMIPLLADLDGDQVVDILLVPYVDWDQMAPLSNQENGVGYPGPNEFEALPLLALRNSGDGLWSDETVGWGLNRKAKGMAAAVADLDGDLQSEIYIASDATANLLFTRGRNLQFDAKVTNAARSGVAEGMSNRENEGNPLWQEIGEISGTAAGSHGGTESSMSATVADFDGNQWPDLLVSNYFGRPNSLYTNHGGLNFRNIAYASRMDAVGKAFLTFGVTNIDYDLDGFWDVIAANGHVLGPNASVFRQTTQVLRNVDGAFVDVSSVSGEFFQRQGLGRSTGTIDFDNDGDTDVVLTFSDSPTALLDNRTSRKSSWVSLQVEDHRHLPLAGGRIELLGRENVLATVPMVTGGSYLSDSQKQWTIGLGQIQQPIGIRVYWADGSVDNWESIEVGQRYRCLPGRLQTLNTMGTR